MAAKRELGGNKNEEEVFITIICLNNGHGASCLFKQ